MKKTHDETAPRSLCVHGGCASSFRALTRRKLATANCEPLYPERGPNRGWANQMSVVPYRNLLLVSCLLLTGCQLHSVRHDTLQVHSEIEDSYADVVDAIGQLSPVARPWHDDARPWHDDARLAYYSRPKYFRTAAMEVDHTYVVEPSESAITTPAVSAPSPATGPSPGVFHPGR